MITNDDLTTIIQAVVQAATLCEAVRSDMNSLQKEAMKKSDKSPVTIADYGSQAIICKRLGEVFPEDPVVAEEDAKDLRLPSNIEQLEKITKYVTSALGGDATIEETNVLGWIDNGNGSPSKRFWTLDPIDGTMGFVRGDQYAICLALIVEGDIKLGITACPALELDGSIGHLFIAEKGKGAVRRPLFTADIDIPMVKIEVNPTCDSFIQSFEASHGNHTTQQAVAKAIHMENVMFMDSQAKYCMVANGKAALYLRLPRGSTYKENIWDHASGAILVLEAGGKISDRDGKPLVFTSAKMTENNGVVVSNGAIHDKVLSALKDY